MPSEKNVVHVGELWPFKSRCQKVKYIKSVLWIVVKHMSYTEDARYLKVKDA